MQAPKIDPRSYEDVVAETEALAQSLTDWQPSSEIDAGGAMVRIFGRFAEVVIERLNQVPEKSFLSFLNLIGADVTPAQSARVPLTFQLAADSPVDAYVPAGTQAAAPPAEDEEEEVIFETERDLLVTRAQLVEVYARAFNTVRDEDQVGHYTAVATGAEEADRDSFAYFAGDEIMTHYLYLACDTLLSLSDPTDVTIRFKTEAAAQLGELPFSCAYWDGENGIWQPFAAEAVSGQTGNDEYELTLAACPPLKAGVVNGVEGGWLRLQLNLPLPPGEERIALEGRSTGNAAPSAIDEAFYPYNEKGDATLLYLSGEEAFLRRGATVSLDVTLATPGVGSKITLALAYYTKGNGDSQVWRTLPILEDSTNGFTQNGRIRFRIPADGSWQVTNRSGWTGRWCRITHSGSYDEVGPQIAMVTAAYDWELPAIDAIHIVLPGDREPLPAETGYLNSQTVDLSKDFYPFGEEPRFNDTFYLAYGDIVTQVGVEAGDTVSLNVALTTPGQAGGITAEESDDPLVTLVWEYWNGRRWQVLGKSTNKNKLAGESNYQFSDGTLAFTKEGEDTAVTFTLPADIAQKTVNGLEDYWLRVRILAGDYGQEAHYADDGTMDVSGKAITVYKPVAATFVPPVLTSLSFDVSAKLQFPLASCQSFNDFTFVDHTQANTTAGATFIPFTPTLDAQPTLYLGFDRPFANRSVTLYTQVLPPKPEQVLPNEFREKVYDDPPQLIWEYFREGGWTRLSVIDETETFAESGLMRFNGPPRFASQPRFGRDLYWLRVRWHDGQFTIFPKGQRIRLNTTWAVQTTTFRNELLGSSNDNPSQTFQALHQPVQLEHLLQVRETDLSETEVTQLQEAAAASLTLDASGNVEEVWVHWQEVPDFYSSGPYDRHYTLDHLTGQIRFGDGVHGMVPPVGQNNIRLSHYRSGGGAQGNRAAETIIQLKSSQPYIDSVINYEPALGGASAETLDSVKRYGPRTLRHRSRAITTADIEDLAFAASFNVARARAVPPRFRPFDLWLEPDSVTPDFTQHEDVEEAGRFGLIIVPKSDAAQPVPSPDLLYRVRTKLLSQMGVTAQLWISGPEWMEVTVAVTLVPVSLTAADYVSESVTAALERFLHPLTGGYEGKGWKFGRRPYLSDLYALIENVPGVDHVTELTINESPEVSKLSPEQFLIYSGTHEITVILET